MDKNKIRLDYNNMMADVIGSKGFTSADFDAVADRVDFAVDYFNEKAPDLWAGQSCMTSKMLWLRILSKQRKKFVASLKTL